MTQSPEDTVFFHQSMTINLGNYEATKVDVGCSFAVRVGESPQDAFNRAVSFVEENLEKQVQEVMGTKPKPSPSSQSGTKVLKERKKKV